MSHGYLVVVPAADPTLFTYLEQRFKGDPAVSVMVDRRRIARATPPVSRQTVRLFRNVTMVRLSASPPIVEGRKWMMEAPAELEDRQRVDRWLEESQYLLGRLIPGYLDDRERLKSRLVAAEQDADRMRQELDGLRREIAALAGELVHQRNEQAATAEAFAAVLGQLNDLQKPLTEVHRRLQTVYSTGVMNGVHAHA
jgi:hypothetical protein